MLYCGIYTDAHMSLLWGLVHTQNYFALHLPLWYSRQCLSQRLRHKSHDTLRDNRIHEGKQVRIPGTVFYNMKAKKYELAFRTKTKKKKKSRNRARENGRKKTYTGDRWLSVQAHVLRGQWRKQSVDRKWSHLVGSSSSGVRQVTLAECDTPGNPS